MVLDGAMGTMIQGYHLDEKDFRGTEFENHPIKLEGNNDILVLTRPDVISAIHRSYLEAGADIIETNTFNSQSISQAEYQTTDFVLKMNKEAVRLARTEADRMTALTPDKPRYVAGSVGPTGKTASMSPDVNNPAFRAISFDELQAAYVEQITALVTSGIDLLLIETIFDTLNTKAALAAAQQSFAETGLSVPLMLSVTIADAAGRTLSGQTLEAFLASVAHADIFSVGLNCSFGADQMLPFLSQLSSVAPYYVSAHPNAGLPDAMGHYEQTPEKMGISISQFLKKGLANIVGGCCGSTPDHIRAIAKVASSNATPPRQPATPEKEPWLAGLDGFRTNGAFINVGERCNVAGSKKFLRLINEKAYDEALAIARKQVRDGAMILDINMDDGMIDTSAEMTNFLNLMASDPEIARLPWMVDSSRFNVIEAALKCIQGKAIVNSISLKEGEEIFLSHAKRVHELGAAIIVMAFDEQGQATTYERKIEVCSRAYHILTEQLNIPPTDIIFDPNVLTIATGMKEHDAYALDFIRATQWIHENLPGAKVSGGVSNLSFSFRGNNYLREAMHAVFLFHAIQAGLDMAIVNPATKVMYADIPSELLKALEDVVLCRCPDATERLVAIAGNYADVKVESSQTGTDIDRNTIPLAQRLITALQCGDDEFLEPDLNEALAEYPNAQAIIEGPLMQGMTLVGNLFGEGKMFLPQVVKTARTMKRAVDILQPHILASRSKTSARNNGTCLLATVKGDVHDIGKNIVGVVLACNNYEVIDLGVMTPAETIVKTALEKNVDFIGLSGLITPSLDEMCNVATQLKAAGINTPLFIGGATTSALHTAVKIAPLYNGPVFHVKDASQNPVLAMQLSGEQHDHTIACLKFEQQQLRMKLMRETDTSLPEEQAEKSKLAIDWTKETITEPTYLGNQIFDNISIETVRPFINWTYFFNMWEVRKGSPEAEKIQAEAEALLDQMALKHHMCAEVGFYTAYGTPSTIVASHPASCPCCGGSVLPITINTPRQRHIGDDGHCLSLSDFVAPQGFGDHIGVFAVTVSKSCIDEKEQLKQEGLQYESLLMQSVSDRLAEATSEWLHCKVRRELWGYAPQEQLSIKELQKSAFIGIRPAIGYPSLPDQKTIFAVSKLIDFNAIGISLTENGAMYPQSSVCGIYLANPHSHYFVM